MVRAVSYSAIVLVLLLVQKGLDAQEEPRESSPAESVAVPSEGLDLIEGIEALEEVMLQDLRLGQLEDAWGNDGYDGLGLTNSVGEGSNRSLGIQTLVEVPFAAASMMPTRSADEPFQHIEITSVAAPLDRFDLRGIESVFDLDTLDRPQIQTYLNFWTTDGRSRMARLLARGGRYRQYIMGRLEDEGLPRELFYLVMIESGFNTTARSRAAAIGLWQFMARTGRSYGLRIDRRVDERRDWEQATTAGMTYLGSLHERFNSWPLAMAAYNAGAGHVRGELRRYDVNNFWAMDEYGAVWDATRAYVYKIIAAAIIGENPEVFGFEAVVYEDPIEYETVEVRGGTRLQVLARAADTDVDTLRELNPSLLVATLPRQDTYQLRIPENSLDSFIEAYDRVDPTDLDQGYVHTLRFGETLDHLAQMYDLSARVLRRANGLARRESVAYGTALVVPIGEDRAERILTGFQPSPEGADEDNTPVAIVPRVQFDYPDLTRVFYEVQDGDGAFAIAAAFNVSPYDLAMWNDIDTDVTLYSDMVLQIFVASEDSLTDVRYFSEDAFRVLALDSPEYQAWDEAEDERRRRSRRTYTVQRGDTVSRIARRFGVSSSSIVRWNDLGSANRIRVGQTLRVR